MSDEGLIRLLSDLIAIPSVNADSTDDPEISGELRVAEFIAEYLAKLGFEISWDDKDTGRPNLVAVHGSDDAARTLLFEAHLDTVGITGMRKAPFNAEIADGKLYGRGACDTKGPMAAALWAMRGDICKRLADAGCRIVFIGAMGEEKGNEGAVQLVRKGLIAADEAIILEPTELDVIHTHKGALWFRITVHGEPAHGSDPDRGLSAIAGMEKVMRVLRELTAQDREKSQNEVLGSPTLSIGVIRGGTELNIVPGECSIEVDRRTLPEEDPMAIIRAIDDELEELRKTGAFNAFAIDIHKDAKPFWTDPSSPLVQRLHSSCTEVANSSKLAGAAWYSDAGPISGVCGQTVVFGPGSIKQAHTSDEFIEVDSLQKGCEILKRFLEKTAGEME